RYKIVKDKSAGSSQEIQTDNFSVSSNISAGGLAFVAAEDLKTNSLLDLQIDLPDKKEPIRCLSKVIWTKKIDDEHFDIGICFLDLTGGERSRLNKYVTEELEDI
ncbi:MAG: PilZ domain-containing protein, partial [Candidatus Omnitrophica bacterium]|nr:PilZ domain-containing protein [Candidatus Omnitrophota bacterium]